MPQPPLSDDQRAFMERAYASAVEQFADLERRYGADLHRILEASAAQPVFGTAGYDFILAELGKWTGMLEMFARPVRQKAELLGIAPDPAIAELVESHNRLVADTERQRALAGQAQHDGAVADQMKHLKGLKELHDVWRERRGWVNLG